MLKKWPTHKYRTGHPAETSLNKKLLLLFLFGTEQIRLRKGMQKCMQNKNYVTLQYLRICLTNYWSRNNKIKGNPYNCQNIYPKVQNDNPGETNVKTHLCCCYFAYTTGKVNYAKY